MTDEEKWRKVVDTVNIPRTMHPTMWPFNDAQTGIAWADAELTALRGEVERLRELRDAAEELADLVDDIRSGNYTPDSFTTQPVRIALRRAGRRE